MFPLFSMTTTAPLSQPSDSPLRSYLFYATLFLLLLSGCKSENSINADFAGKLPKVRVDTVYVTDLYPDSLPMFNGALNLDVVVGVRYGAAGSYNDPVFGQTDAIHLLRPRLTSKALIDTIDQNTRLFLELRKEGITGDTLNATTFNLVEINRGWRGNAWTKDSSITNGLGQTLATFTWTNEDSVLIPLPDSFRDRYSRRSYTPDSISVPDIHGFAVVPSGSGKIVMIRSENIRMFMFHTYTITGTTRDTTIRRAVFMRSWATSWASSGRTVPAGSMLVDNTFRNVISFDIEATPEKLGTRNVLNAELVMFEDTVNNRLNLPPNHIRARSSQMDLFQLAQADLRYDLYHVTPSLRMQFTAADKSYRTNLTNVLNTQLRRNQLDGLRFYLSYKANSGIGSAVKGNDGTIYRIVMHAPSSPTRKPMLIITSALPDA